MNDENDNVSDLSARFRLDQQAASDEEQTREQTQWDLACKGMEADVAMKNAHAARTIAAARIWRAITVLIYVAIVVGVLTWLAWDGPR